MDFVCSQEEIHSSLEYILNHYKMKNIIFADESPAFKPALGKVQIFNKPRFIWQLDVNNHNSEKPIFHFASRGKITSCHGTPGDVLFFSPFSWNTIPESQGNRKVVALSVVLQQNYLRLVYTGYSKLSGQYASFFYHLEDTYSKEINLLMNAVNGLSKRFECHEAAKSLLRSTLEIVLQDIKISSGSIKSKAYEKWCRMVLYMQENFSSDLCREDIAQEFEVTPFYVSRLFTRYSNMGFIKNLHHMRLEKATQLLKTTNMNLDEIAWQCGYNYTPYFIRVFKEKFNMTPSQFRSK